MSSEPNQKRQLKIALINQQPKLVTRTLAEIEQEIEKLHSYEIETIGSFEDSYIKPFDLIVMIAIHLGPKELFAWIKSTSEKIARNHHIPVPCLIISETPSHQVSELTEFAVKENWYFDVVDTKHVASCPMRIANLLRIHDHIHELRRYDQTVTELNERVNELERQLETLRR